MLQGNRTFKWSDIFFPLRVVCLPTSQPGRKIAYAVGGRSSIHLCRGLRCCTMIVTGLPFSDGGASASESANACRCDFGRTGQGRTVEAEAATVTTEPTKVSAKRKETKERRCWVVGERSVRKGIYSFIEGMSARKISACWYNYQILL